MTDLNPRAARSLGEGMKFHCPPRSKGRNNGLRKVGDGRAAGGLIRLIAASPSQCDPAAEAAVQLLLEWVQSSPSLSQDDYKRILGITSNMQDVSVAKLKMHLASFLQRVEDGEEFTITKRGRPVALLTKPLRGRGVPRLGTLHGTIRFTPGWDAPMSDEEVAEFLGDRQ